MRLKGFEEIALSSWISELPAANMGLATRLMHDFIVDSNTLEMPSQLRLNALELLRPSVLMIEDYLRSRLIRTGFPKEENDQKILNVLVAIEREFAIGYWTILKDLTRRTVGWFQGKNTALALQRCIKGLSSIVVSHFIMGMPIPDWVWLDLHSLYKLSVKIEKNSIKVSNDMYQASKTSSAEDCYLQILLLSLVEPTGLMQKEILLVDNFIETICSLVSLRSTPVQGNTLQCLVFNDEDKPPVYQLGSATKKDGSVLYIDFTKLQKVFEHKERLIDVTEARFSSVQMQKNTTGKLAAELLDYLEQRWAGVSLQGEPLFSDRLDRYIAIGLAATLELQDVTDASIDKKDLEFLVQSESERLLSCVFNQTGVLSVGSLVSFRKTDMPEHERLLGVIDKVIVARQTGKIIFGVKLLTPEFTSVDYNQFDANAPETPPAPVTPPKTAAESSKKDTAKNAANSAPTPAPEPLKKGLFYTNNEQEYLITDTFMLKDEDTLRIHLHNDSFSVSLKNRKNVGLGYWQFECIRLKEKKKHILPTANKKGYDFI
ncbi:Cyclic-di-GMP receptor FimW [Patescibacteria group bacterium]|nr:Cyclic-di-GMP receptor FimW [Patescibacteria group bacterium]